MGEAKAGVVSVILKADVQGSAEALRDALPSYPLDEVKVKVLSQRRRRHHRLRRAAGGCLQGLDHRLQRARRCTARAAMKELGVEVRYYSVIYEAIDDVKQLMSGCWRRRSRRRSWVWRGARRIPLQQVRHGCRLSGDRRFVKRNNPIRVLRDNVVIFEGGLESLRRFKDDVSEVRAGTECGIGVKDYDDVRVGDQIECYFRTEVARTV